MSNLIIFLIKILITTSKRNNSFSFSFFKENKGLFGFERLFIKSLDLDLAFRPWAWLVWPIELASFPWGCQSARS